MSDGYDRDPVVPVRMDETRLEALERVVEFSGWNRSRLIRAGVDHVLETQGEALEDAGALEQLAAERDQIVEEGQEADRILGFPRRVANRLESLFKDDWEAEKLRDSVKSYYREAENLEQQAEVHPDVESVEPGEFVEAVDRALEETITAVHLSDWDERDRYEKFDGVASGKQAERQALALTRSMMKRDQDLEALRSLSETNPRVEAAHAPSEAHDEDLPEGVTLEDVAEQARHLVDEGLDPEALPLDPVEFRRQAPEEVLSLLGDRDDRADDPGLEDGSVTVETETDGGALEAAADGGDHVAVQVFDEGADGDRPDRGDDGPGLEDLVEEAAEKLREAGSYSSDAHTDDYVEKKRKQKRERAEEHIRLSFESDTETWRDELMADTDLTPDDVIELADEYNEAIDAAIRGEREDAPEVVVDGNGGVRLE